MGKTREGRSSSSQNRGAKIGMDVRQVALGAVFGAAVAINAALQSLQDAGSFLIQGPSSKSSTSSPLPTVSRPRKLIRSAANLDREQASVFRAFLDGEDDDDVGTFGNSDSEEHLLSSFSPTVPTIDTGAGFFEEDLAGLNSSCLKARHGPKKLQVKRKNVETTSHGDHGQKAQCYLKGSDEENSSTEDGDALWGNSSSSTNVQVFRRTGRQPVFVPLLPQVIQSEEAMSAMLQHTTNTVLETLSEAKEQREQMVEEMKRLHLPEEQTSLQLLSRFIDALINVGDSLMIVHSALFSKKDGHPHVEPRPLF